MGTDSLEESSSYVPVALDEPLLTIEAGHLSTCALTEAGKAYCWGNNLNGQIGVGEVGRQHNTPQEVSTDQRFVGIAPGLESVCAWTSESDIYCWGKLLSNFDVPLLDSPGPVKMETEHRFKEIVTSYAGICGLTESGHVYCWGSGHLGICGTDNNERCYEPNRIDFDEPVRSISASYSVPFACAITESDRLYCWGDNEAGHLGRPEKEMFFALRPALIPFDEPIHAVQAGRHYGCALTDSGAPYCWGSSHHPNRPRPEFAHPVHPRQEEVHTPRPIDGAPSFVQLSLGADHSCGRTAPGDLYCWGTALMTGEEERSEVPIRMPEAI